MALVGQGVELGNAQEELRIFLEKADIPAGRTLMVFADRIKVLITN